MRVRKSLAKLMLENQRWILWVSVVLPACGSCMGKSYTGGAVTEASNSEGRPYAYYSM